MACCINRCPNSGANPSKDTTYHLFPHPEKGLLSNYHLFKKKKKPISNELLFLFNFSFTDQSRFRRWVAACNDPRFDSLDPMTIHKRYRICRRHFDSECLNGGCRRLLNTAVPSLHLSGDRIELNAMANDNSNSIDMKDDDFLLAKNEISIVAVTNDESIDDPEEHFEIIPTSKPTPIFVPSIEGMCCYKIDLKIGF